MGDSTPPIVLWGTFVIAVVGFLQPYVWPRLRRKFAPRKIDVFEALRPDIGFASQGPIVGIAGVIYNKNAPSLVRRMQLRVSDVDGQVNLILPALLNRERQIKQAASGSDDILLGRIWLPFRMEANSNEAFDVVFGDLPTHMAIDQILSAMKTEWIGYMLQRRRDELGRDLRPDDFASLDSVTPIYYQDWLAALQLTERWQSLELLFPWAEGRYELTLEIEVLEEKRPFSASWAIDLTADNEAGLRANIARLVGLNSNRAANSLGRFYSAWPEYEALRA
jgi:hypothetical protein